MVQREYTLINVPAERALDGVIDLIIEDAIKYFEDLKNVEDFETWKNTPRSERTTLR